MYLCNGGLRIDTDNCFATPCICAVSNSVTYRRREAPVFTRRQCGQRTTPSRRSISLRACNAFVHGTGAALFSGSQNTALLPPTTSGTRNKRQHVRQRAHPKTPSKQCLTGRQPCDERSASEPSPTILHKHDFDGVTH